MNSKNIPIKLLNYEIPKDKPESEYNEAEKMIAGLTYDPMVEELANGRLFAKQKIQELNKCDVLNFDLRNQILKDLLGTSNDVYIEPPFYCDHGTNIHFGKGCYLNHNCIFLDNNKITIGSSTFIGPNVQVYTAIHPLDPIERRQGESGKPITIGSDCWIGGSAVILPGITIGDGVTVGAGSVVTKDVEDYTVVAGNPARIIRRLDKPK